MEKKKIYTAPRWSLNTKNIAQGNSADMLDL